MTGWLALAALALVLIVVLVTLRSGGEGPGDGGTADVPQSGIEVPDAATSPLLHAVDWVSVLGEADAAKVRIIDGDRELSALDARFVSEAADANGVPLHLRIAGLSASQIGWIVEALSARGYVVEVTWHMAQGG